MTPPKKKAARAATYKYMVLRQMAALIDGPPERRMEVLGVVEAHSADAAIEQWATLQGVDTPPTVYVAVPLSSWHEREVSVVAVPEVKIEEVPADWEPRDDEVPTPE
jgi:hypothetical protein